MGSCSFDQLLLKFKEVYIHVSQHFHVAKQCQKIIGSCEPQLVPSEGFQEFGDIDLALPSILSLILYLINQGEFLIQ